MAALITLTHYKSWHNEQIKLTDSGAEVIGSTQIQIKATCFDQNCDSGIETLMENAKPYERVVNYPHGLGKSKNHRCLKLLTGWEVMLV